MPFSPSLLPPGDKGGQKSRKFLIPQQSTPRAPKHKPNSSHNASLLANLGFLPQRSASILNGNYYSYTHTQTHILIGVHTHYLGCTDEMQKTKRRKGGVQGDAQKKMRCSEKKMEEV